MAEPSPTSPSPAEISQSLLIVVGAHLRAEQADRPLAYQLQAEITDWLDKNQPILGTTFTPLVCCDVLYVNHTPMHRRPTICIGGPGVNALSAYFNSRLRPVMVREDQMVIQLDPEFIDLRVCLWGMNHELTRDALNFFERKYLTDFLRAVATQVEPQVD